MYRLLCVFVVIDSVVSTGIAATMSPTFHESVEDVSIAEFLDRILQIRKQRKRAAIASLANAATTTSTTILPIDDMIAAHLDKIMQYRGLRKGGKKSQL